MDLREDLAFMKDVCAMKSRRRKRMEAAATGRGNNNFGEVRRIHIIYFLSRMGHVEHPHLIRVHHLSRNGVYLRDVKRWLAEVRGKDMPEAFSWSYKRRYKTGYVWQDLLDDDLITPISDNEYVLKGSECIPHTTFDHSSADEKKPPNSRNDQPVEDEDQPSQEEQTQERPDRKVEASPSREMSPENYEESPQFGSERSTLTDDSMKLHEDDTVKQNTNERTEKSEDHPHPSATSFYSTLLLKKKKLKNKKTESSNNSDNNQNNNNNDVKKTAEAPAAGSLFSSSSSPHKSQFAKSKSHSNGASRMLRNLIKCGAIDTNDAVLATVNRTDTTSLTKSVDKPDFRAAICQGDKIGASARIFGTPWNDQHQQQYRARKSFDGATSSKKKNDYASTKPVSSAYKPVGGPTCSKCRKTFQPEKMHKHMQSCKGMKALAKNCAVSTEKTPRQIYFNLSPQDSNSGSLITS